MKFRSYYRSIGDSREQHTRDKQSIPEFNLFSQIDRLLHVAADTKSEDETRSASIEQASQDLSQTVHRYFSHETRSWKERKDHEFRSVLSVLLSMAIDARVKESVMPANGDNGNDGDGQWVERIVSKVIAAEALLAQHGAEKGNNNDNTNTNTNTNTEVAVMHVFKEMISGALCHVKLMDSRDNKRVHHLQRCARYIETILDLVVFRPLPVAKDGNGVPVHVAEFVERLKSLLPEADRSAICSHAVCAMLKHTCAENREHVHSVVERALSNMVIRGIPIDSDIIARLSSRSHGMSPSQRWKWVNLALNTGAQMDPVMLTKIIQDVREWKQYDLLQEIHEAMLANPSLISHDSASALLMQWSHVENPNAKEAIALCRDFYEKLPDEIKFHGRVVHRLMTAYYIHGRDQWFAELVIRVVNRWESNGRVWESACFFTETERFQFSKTSNNTIKRFRTWAEESGKGELERIADQWEQFSDQQFKQFDRDVRATPSQGKFAQQAGAVMNE